MTSFEQGRFSDLDVTRHRSIQGAVSGTVFVRSGHHLLIQGHFDGDLNVEDDAMATIQGSAQGVVSSNAGLILVAGLLAWDPRAVPGRLAVGIGTLLSGNADVGILEGDGSISSIPSGDVTIKMGGADSYCVFDHQADAFVPIASVAADEDGSHDQGRGSTTDDST